ncbi:hypothetical protein GCM10025738_16600 [Microbacterium fluvii]
MLVIGALAPSAASAQAIGDEEQATAAPTPSAAAMDDNAPQPSPTPAATAADETSTPAPTPTPTSSESETPTPVVSSRAVAPDATTAASAVVPATSRIGDADISARAVSASEAAYPDGASTVVVSLGDAAVAPAVASGLAAELEAPLLFITGTSVPSAVTTEITRLGATDIIVAASAGKVSSSVYTALGRLGTVEKLVVDSRYTGAREVLSRLSHDVGIVYLTGSSLLAYPVVVAAAAAKNRAALMVDGTASSAGSRTIAALKRTGASKIIVFGGATSVSSGYIRSLRDAGFTVSRRAEGDIYALSTSASATYPAGVDRAVIVNPKSRIDAALGAALAGATSQMLAYSTYACVPSGLSGQISAQGATVLPLGTTYWLTSAVASNTPCSEQNAKAKSSLQSAINATIAQRGGKYAVTAYELGATNVMTGTKGSTKLEPASMMKLYAAWVALKRVQDAKTTTSSVILSSGYSLRSCIRIMIHVSDNYCHDDIVHWLGVSRLNSAIKKAGFSSTKYGASADTGSVLYAGNRTTTNDLVRFMKKLREGDLLDASRTDFLLDLMGDQIWRTRIPSGIPAGIVQQSKPGALWIAAGLLQADTAIVYGKRSTYVLSIIGYDDASKADLAAISRTVYTYFNGSFGDAKVYPAKQMVTTKSISMRSSAAGKVVGTIPKGKYVEITDSRRKWYKLYYGSKLVWVDSGALKNR